MQLRRELTPLTGELPFTIPVVEPIYVGHPEKLTTSHSHTENAVDLAA